MILSSCWHICNFASTATLIFLLYIYSNINIFAIVNCELKITTLCIYYMKKSFHAQGKCFFKSGFHKVRRRSELKSNVGNRNPIKAGVINSTILLSLFTKFTNAPVTPACSYHPARGETDIVGYTALMGDDEQKAFELLNRSRLLQKPIIEQYNGKEDFY
jgi:hypothetical protein